MGPGVAALGVCCLELVSSSAAALGTEAQDRTGPFPVVSGQRSAVSGQRWSWGADTILILFKQDALPSGGSGGRRCLGVRPRSRVSPEGSLGAWPERLWDRPAG